MMQDYKVMNLRIFVFGEQCNQAGQAVPQGTLDDYDDPTECDDWVCHEGTAEELLAKAETLPTSRGRGYDPYKDRVANTIRSYVYTVRPDLEPDEEE